MIWTTKVKITLKKALPGHLFNAVRFIADKTILKITPLLFGYKVRNFTAKTIKNISYTRARSFKIILDPANGYLDAYIYAYGPYESQIIREIVSNIKEGDTCIDVGANIGHHTIIMSQAVGQKGKVYAYEPIPHIRKQMEESLALNHIHNVTVLGDALSFEDGIMTLSINESNIAGSSFINTGGTKQLKVTVKKLDSYNYTNVAFIKIDVEGFEYAVLKGAERLFTDNRPVTLFEYSPVYYRKNSPSDCKDILTFFKDKNYTLIDLDDGRKTILDLDAFVKEFSEGLRSQTNVLALP